MPPGSPSDLSRPRLKALAAWIRDELDPLVARDGPERLRADDVLVLHETFQALRTSTTITAMDLRATGIHKAVMEVAGIATRWPGRLADDCDQIILAWTSKFGNLEDLHPFMYGRGGRLEGIAKPGEFSRAALLKRWQTTCPERIASKRSHRHGSLGFRPGAWWLNSMFACYSGIIDLAATEGGVVFDERGAYAVVLTGTTEVEAPTESSITYRCKQNDKGKFRLTSADVRSREPLRVFRSHDLNSVWGPKAGIRYEGLYRCTGWAIHTAKHDDHTGGQHKEGDILYDVKFERIDEVPMSEVMTHPTATELDDYTEYKRLRRVHREEQRKDAPEHGEVQWSPKSALTLPPGTIIASQLRPITSKPSPSISKTATFIKDPLGMDPNTGKPQTSPSKLSSAGSRSSPLLSTSDQETTSGEYQKDTLVIPSTRRSPNEPLPDSAQLQPTKDVAMSEISEQSNRSELREVAPWIDFDPEMVSAAPSIATRLSRPQEVVAPLTRGVSLGPKTRQFSETQSIRSSPFMSSSTLDKGKYAVKSNSSKALNKGKGKDREKSPVGPSNRSHNPLAKLFDGADGAMDQYEDDSLDEDRRSVPPSNDGTRPLSPIPLRPTSPWSPLITARRAEIFLPPVPSINDDTSLTDYFTPVLHPGEDPPEDMSRAHAKPQATAFSIKGLISAAKLATPVSVSPGVSSIISDRPCSPMDGNETHSTRGVFLYNEQRTLLMDTTAQRHGGVLFRDPFRQASDSKHVVRGGIVEDLAPDGPPLSSL